VRVARVGTGRNQWWAVGGGEQGTQPVMQPVMVADDNRDIREVVREALENSGFAVVLADDGVEALDRVTDQRPRVIVHPAS
jgi:PleD family two-component response regulator